MKHIGLFPAGLLFGTAGLEADSQPDEPSEGQPADVEPDSADTPPDEPQPEQKEGE